MNDVKILNNLNFFLIYSWQKKRGFSGGNKLQAKTCRRTDTNVK